MTDVLAEAKAFAAKRRKIKKFTDDPRLNHTTMIIGVTLWQIASVGEQPYLLAKLQGATEALKALTK